MAVDPKKPREIRIADTRHSERYQITRELCPVVLPWWHSGTRSKSSFRKTRFSARQELIECCLDFFDHPENGFVVYGQCRFEAR
jgi:hypothetical protein